MQLAELEPCGNLLVRAMAAPDRERLAAHLERIALPRDTLLVGESQPITHVYFPEGGIASVVAGMDSGARTEVGIFGREGMSGTPLLMGSDISPLSTFMQVPGGTALRIPAAALMAAIGESVGLHLLLLRFCHSFTIQTAHGALANAHQRIEGRLARWLLMCHDRLDQDDIALTHEFMAIMIAAQRTGVTLALHILEGAGMIRARRGRVTILDRARLIALAGESYGTPEAEYRRLIGPLTR